MNVKWKTLSRQFLNVKWFITNLEAWVQGKYPRRRYEFRVQPIVHNEKTYNKKYAGTTIYIS